MSKRPARGAGKLTPKQARFVEEYLIDANAKQAAIRAGYSARSAEVTGSKLLSNAKVLSALTEAQASRSERVKIDADWVLDRLTNEATADLSDIIDDGGAIRPVRDWPLIWRQGLVTGIDVKQETSEGVVIGETVKLRLSDRIKRIDLIGKHVDVRAFREQIGISNPEGGPVTIAAEKLSTSALRELMGAMSDKTPDADGG